MLPKLARILYASAARKAVSSTAPCGLILFLGLALAGISARGQSPMTVRGDFNQLLNQKTGKRDVAITPLFTISSTGTNLIVGGQTNRFQTDSNNVLTVYSTNINALYSGFAYRITYFPVADTLYGSRPQSFTNYFPIGAETNDPVNLADASYLVGSTNSPFQTLGGVFLRKSNDMGSNLTFIGKTTLGTGTTVGYVWTATNADGSGDYQESTGAGGGISAATATNIVKAAIPTNFWSSDAGLWLSNIVANVTNQIGKATSSHIGLLDPADWTTFNNKQPLDTTLTQLSGVNTNTLARTDQVNGKISTNNGTGWNMTIKGAWHQDQNATFRGVPTGITVVNLTPDIAELEIDDNGAYADDIPFGEARFYGPLHPQWVGPLVLLDGIGGTPFYTNDLAPNTVTSPESHPVFIVNPDHSVTEFSDVDVSFNPYLWRHTTGETNIYPLDGLHIGGNAEAETNLNASELRSGTVPPARLGSGTSISTKFLRGDSTWQTIGGGGDLLSANNLSDVANTATALANLGGVPTSRTITINGTANQITSSAAAQDLSANRTVTLSLANTLELPGSLSVGTGLGGGPFTVRDDGSGNIQLKLNNSNFAVFQLNSILLGAMDGNALVNLNASHVSGTFPGQYYASNAVSGGQFPIGTLATNTGTDGQVLSKTGNNRKWIDVASGSDSPWTADHNFAGYSGTNGNNLTVTGIVTAAQFVINNPSSVNISNANLAFRVRGDDANGIVANGGAITNLQPWIGSIFTNVNSTVTLSSNRYNGHSALNFAGTTTTWLQTTSAVFTTAMDKAFTMFEVVEFTNNPSGLKVISIASSQTFYSALGGFAQNWKANSLSVDDNVGYVVSAGTSNITRCVLFFRWDGTNTWIGNGIDWEEKSYPAGPTLNLNTRLLELGAFNTSGGFAFPGYIADLLIYNTNLSRADCRAIATKLHETYGITTNYCEVDYCEGDSMTAGGTGATVAQAWPSLLATNFPERFIYNGGVGGDTLANIASTIGSTYLAPGQKGKYTLFAARNDNIISGTDPLTLLNLTKQIATNTTVKGWKFYYIPMPPAVTGGGTYELCRSNFNTMLFSQWNDFASGIIHVEKNPLFWTNSTSGTLWATDNVHPNAAGQEYITSEVIRTWNGDGLASLQNIKLADIFSLPTNYVSANFIPIPGFVNVVCSNKVIYGVSDTKTNLLLDLQ